MSAVDFRRAPERGDHVRMSAALLNKAFPVAEAHDSTMGSRPPTGFWERLLTALHKSRRRAAAREVRRYRHLLQDSRTLKPRSTKPAPSLTESEGNAASRSAPLLILLACFAIIHGIAVVHMESTRSIHHPPSSAATEALPHTD